MYKCPMCGKGVLRKVAGNCRYRALMRLILFRPMRLLMIIWGQLQPKYKCPVCKGIFDKQTLEENNSKIVL